MPERSEFKRDGEERNCSRGSENPTEEFLGQGEGLPAPGYTLQGARSGAPGCLPTMLPARLPGRSERRPCLRPRLPPLPLHMSQEGPRGMQPPELVRPHGRRGVLHNSPQILREQII